MSFKVDLRKFADSVDEDAATLTRSLALQIFTSVVRRTPVDKGIARASWVLSVGKPAPQVSTTAAAISGPSGIAGFNWNLKADIYISSFIPYIQKLENGSSKQAPTGMVAQTLADFGAANA